jgi:hypothetical protein
MTGVNLHRLELLDFGIDVAELGIDSAQQLVCFRHDRLLTL